MLLYVKLLWTVPLLLLVGSSGRGASVVEAKNTVFKVNRLSDSVLDFHPNQDLTEEDDLSLVPIVDEDDEQLGLPDEASLAEQGHRQLQTAYSYNKAIWIAGATRCAATYSMRLQCLAGGRLVVEKVRYNRRKPSCSSTKCTWSSSSSTTIDKGNTVQVDYSCRASTSGLSFRYALRSKITPSGVAKSSCSRSSSAGRVLTHATALVTYDFRSKGWKSNSYCDSNTLVDDGVRYCHSRGQCISSCPPRLPSITQTTYTISSNSIGYLGGRMASDNSTAPTDTSTFASDDGFSFNDTLLELFLSASDEELASLDSDPTSGGAEVSSLWMSSLVSAGVLLLWEL